MPKIVVNKCFGGFGLSHEAIMRYSELANLDLKYNKGKSNWQDCYYKNGVEDRENYFYDRDLHRDDPILVQVVEELGRKAGDDYANLEVIEIPDDVDWYIHDYDGMETIREKHRIW